jgi:hypothetical protein
MEYTATYCVECYATFLPAHRSVAVTTFMNASQFVEEHTSEYNEPIIDADGVCFHCGYKGVVICYKMLVTN